jgi:hypothetical protein
MAKAKGSKNRLRSVTCVDCGLTFETSAGNRKRCDPCRATHKRTYGREQWRRSIPDLVCVDCGAPIDFGDEAQGRRAKRCPEHAAEHERQRLVRKETLRRYRRHGIDEATYLDLLERQGGRCAICRTETPDAAGRSWHIDHDHTCCSGPYSCGKCVRGLLCGACNQGVGYFRDNPELLKAAIAYLERDIVRQILNSPNRDEDGDLIPE